MGRICEVSSATVGRAERVNIIAARILWIVHLTRCAVPLINLSIVQHLMNCTIFGQRST